MNWFVFIFILDYIFNVHWKWITSLLYRHSKSKYLCIWNVKYLHFTKKRCIEYSRVDHSKVTDWILETVGHSKDSVTKTAKYWN